MRGCTSQPLLARLTQASIAKRYLMRRLPGIPEPICRKRMLSFKSDSYCDGLRVLCCLEKEVRIMRKILSAMIGFLMIAAIVGGCRAMNIYKEDMKIIAMQAQQQLEAARNEQP